jgi:hypothetical protein
MESFSWNAAVFALPGRNSKPLGATDFWDSDPASGVGGVPVFTRVYAVRGAIPFGPLWPGAGLFWMETGGTEDRVAVS